MNIFQITERDRNEKYIFSAIKKIKIRDGFKGKIQAACLKGKTHTFGWGSLRETMFTDYF